MRALQTSTSANDAPRISVLVPKESINNVEKSGLLARKIALPTMEGIHFQKVQNIISLEAKGNYTMLYFIDGTKLLVCKTLRNLEEILNGGNQFVRIHRSFTINLNCIEKYIKGKGGYVVMENGTSISVSAGKKQHFLDTLEIYFS